MNSLVLPTNLPPYLDTILRAGPSQERSASGRVNFRGRHAFVDHPRGWPMTTHEAGSEPRRIGTPEVESPLAARIEDQIALRVSGRIHDLHVICDGHEIILQGWSRTYHAKQLAQEAALDLIVLDGAPFFMNNEIVVS
jgi:hypothetical protein